MADENLEQRVKGYDLGSKLSYGTNELSNGAKVIYKRSNFLLYYLAQPLSIIGKVALMSNKVAQHPKGETLDILVDSLEKNEDLKNLTVRVDHAKPLTDAVRLFTDKRIKEEIPFYQRLLLGLPITLTLGTYSKFTRLDHYNTFTHTDHHFSDVPALALQIAGYADYMTKRKHSLPYQLMYYSFIPWVGYQASKYVDQHLPQQYKYQKGRFIYPLLGAGVGASISGTTGALIGGLAGLGVGMSYNAYKRARNIVLPEDEKDNVVDFPNKPKQNLDNYEKAA